MSVLFSRTVRALGADSFRRPTLSLGIGAFFAVGWLSWMVFAKVSVYEASPSARLEVDQATHPIQAPVGGRVNAINLKLGHLVAIGDVLLELDADSERLRVGEARARISAISNELVALRREAATSARAREEDSEGLPAAVGEATARHKEAVAQAALAADQLTRVRRLHESGAVAKTELVRAEAELARLQAGADAFRLAVGRTANAKRTESTDRLAKGEGLEREISVLEGEQLTLHATIERLEHEVERRTVRATVAGRVAEVGVVTVGAMIEEGTRVGAIVPKGDLKVLAEYAPPAAFGRIQTGQPARLRLDGFPWAQYGTVVARVERVASEVRDGKIRVELNVFPDPTGRIPMQHGLPGTIEIEVERAAPATLLLRAAGKLIDGESRPGSPAGVVP